MKKQYLVSAELDPNIDIEKKGEYPFTLPVVRNLDNIDFHEKVTYVIGENGTGKSTLLEAIASNYGFNPEGGSKNFNFNTRASHSSLDKYIKVGKGINRPKDGYFLRAESFFNVASNIEKIDRDAGDEVLKKAYGGKSLHEQSHGESFFSLFLHRFFGNGLYILDEPEAALSPQRQLAFLARLDELVKLDSQFIIATHSPIIMAYPNAKI